MFTTSCILKNLLDLQRRKKCDQKQKKIWSIKQTQKWQIDLAEQEVIKRYYKHIQGLKENIKIMREMETINIKKEPNKLLKPKIYYIWDF